MARSASAYSAGVRDGLRPEPRLTVAAWADAHRMLSGRSTAEPGRWRTSRTPYLREPMECLSATSPVRRVVVMKAARLGFTEAACNWLGYIIHHVPGPFLCVEPTVEMAKRLSRQSIDPMIQDSPALRTRIAPARSRDAGNTVLLKEFPGGLLVLAGANSAAGLRSMAARFLCFDEIDGYPGDVDGEGDPIALAEARARTFPRRKLLLISTPTVAGMSRIEREYAATDRRRFFVPCPTCQAMQPLEFAQLRWQPGRPETARYVCAACGVPIGEEQKTRMLAAGVWRPTAVADDPSVAGFHLSALYSPLGWFSWVDIARAAEDAARDPLKQKTFDNTILGETYAERGDAPDWQRLRDRQTTAARGVVPPGARFLTAGIDVQRDRLECSIWGWGRGRRSWLVDHVILEGDVATEEPWAALDEVVARTWPAAGGLLAVPLARAAIDTGYETTQVHAWARRQPAGRVVLVRGGGRAAALVSLPRPAEAVDARATTRRRRRRGLRVWMVDDHAIKLETYGWLRLERGAAEAPLPAGWIALPPVGDEFLRQLTAEQLVRKVVRGREQLVWVKRYNRNEVLDCRVYARAAAHLVGLDRFTDADWDALDAPFAAAAAAPLAPETPPRADAGRVPIPGAAPPAAVRRRPPSDFWAGRPRR
jgi:phage terminase large subunit GpA-like protein